MDGPTNSQGERGIIDYSGRLLTNDNVRHELSLGNAYRFGHRFSAVGAGATVNILFDPSNNGVAPGRVYKVKAFVESIAYPITMKFYEDPTITANGTEVIVYNFNRCSECDASLNSNAKCYYGPSVDSSGNEYGPSIYIFADTSAPGLSISIPGDIADEFSVYLNPTRKYLWSFTNEGDGATDIQFNARLIYEQDYRAGGR